MMEGGRGTVYEAATTRGWPAGALADPMSGGGGLLSRAVNFAHTLRRDFSHQLPMERPRLETGRGTATLCRAGRGWRGFYWWQNNSPLESSRNSLPKGSPRCPCTENERNRRPTVCP